MRGNTQVLAAAVIAGLAGTAQAGLFEVGSGKPYATIQSAVDAAAALDSPVASDYTPPADPVQIVIDAGTYNEYVTIPGDATGKYDGANDRWTIKAASGATVWLTGGFDVGGNRDNGVFEGINIKQTASTGWGYNFNYLARAWKVRNGIVYQDGSSSKGAGRGELQYGGTDYEHMTVFGSAYGFSLNYAAWGTLKNSIIANVGSVGISAYNSYGGPAMFGYSYNLFNNNGTDVAGPSALNQGNNLLNTDPMFASTDPNSPDFLFLQSGSPAATAGEGGTYMGARGVVVSSPQWALDGSGSWSVSSNWTGGVPNSNGAVAKLGGVITGNATVTLDVPVIVGRIEFDNSNTYTIAGPSALTLNNGAGASLKVTSGSHVISADVTAVSNTTMDVTPASSSLNLSGAFIATGVSLTKSGAGTLQMNNVRSGNLTLNGGVLSVNAGGSGNSTAGASRVTGLSFAGGPAAPVGKLDLKNNALVIAYTGGSPQSDIRQLISAAFAGGGWTGNGLTSSLAGGSPAMGLGYAENTAIGRTSFAGQDANGSVIVAYTAVGDSNLDGKVNTVDFNNLAGGFGSSGQFWINGDFDYNGSVDSIDFAFLSGNYGVSVPAGAALGSVVPEPASLSSILLGGLLGRRKR